MVIPIINIIMFPSRIVLFDMSLRSSSGDDALFSISIKPMNEDNPSTAKETVIIVE
jgi:hypothetical protein